MNIKIDSVFDETFFADRGIFIWKLISNRSTKNLKAILIFGTILLIVGVLTLEKAPGTIFVAVIYMVYAVYTLRSYLIAKRKFKEKLNKLLSDLKKENCKIEYSFTDTHFSYIDSKREITLSWNAFLSYSIKDNFILLNQSDNFEQSFALGQAELTIEYYNEIKTFLSDNSKLKLKEI